MAGVGSQRRGAGSAIFPKLSGGPGGRPPELVAAHQRGRLMGAMVEAVARHGYAGTTLRELVSLAGVSKTTFYQHFTSKQDCFLATFETIDEELMDAVLVAFRRPGNLRQRFLAALAAAMGLVVEMPKAASLAAVESLTLGAAGIAHRARANRGLEEIVREGFASEPSPHDDRISDDAVRAIVGGIRGVIYRRLRATRGAELPDQVEPLVDWGLSYRIGDNEAVIAAMAAAAAPAPAPSAADGNGRPPWGEPPDSPRSRARLSQRERIVRAAARTAVATGYQSLSIPAISAAAGVSNQTFYENFSGKREAFLAAFDEVAAEALTVTRAACASAGERPRRVGVALRALLEHIAANEILARLSFVELPTAGPAALDRVDAMLESWKSLVEPERVPGAVGERHRELWLDAVTGGIWETVQLEVAGSRLASLPELAPDLARLALMPFAER